jgi:hypothetical protein
VDFKDFFRSFSREVRMDLPVKSVLPSEAPVKNIGTVGGSHNDNA